MQIEGDSTKPADIDDETLVAYLDGELTPEDTSWIDHGIAQDARLKKRVDDLRKSWDLLGELPPVEPNPKLAQSTIEMVSLSIDRSQRSWLEWLRSNAWLGMLGGTLLAIGLGAVVSAGVSQVRLHGMMQELPMVLHFRQMASIDSLAWLKRLAEIDELQRVAEENLLGNPAASQRHLTTELPDTSSARIAWLRNLEDQEVASVEMNYRDYQSVAPERRAVLREISEYLNQMESDRRQQLLELIEAYDAVLTRVRATTRARLFSTEDLDERAAEFETLIRRELAFQYPQRIEVGSHDYRAIRNWTYNIQDQEEVWDFLYRRGLDLDSQIIAELYRDESESFVTSRDIDDLRDKLSLEARELLSGMDDRYLRYTLGLWVNHVLEPSGGNGSAPDLTELKARFKKLPLDKQTELEFLPEQEARQQLMR